MSVDEVKAALRRGNEAAREGRERLESATPMIVEAGASIRQTTDDSRDDMYRRRCGVSRRSRKS